jgi:UDP-N-acetylmuramate--alanine ligase
MGGPSREREISFAGGRTVMDNLDRALFEPVPIFIDSRRGVPVLLHWTNLYKGTIRDFFPPSGITPKLGFEASVYAEQVDWADEAAYDRALAAIGTPLNWGELAQHIDVAFLTLHGALGEDGALQGLIEWLGIPYTGSGIAASAWGIDKLAQRRSLASLGFASPHWMALNVEESLTDVSATAQAIASKVGYPCVLKHPLQGSSIGVRVVRGESELEVALMAVAFRQRVDPKEWRLLSREDREAFARQLTDVRVGLSLPIEVYSTAGDFIISLRQPDTLLEWLDANDTPVELRAADAPTELLVEQFIVGDEFSAIVVEDESGRAVSLPPTQILKAGEVFDYRMKYLPGQARKLTPMPLPDSELRALCAEAERLYAAAGFSVYARLDGIRANDGTVYFNDPNTTSGMLPSSFFFHQAAEVGLSPSALLTTIIRSSLGARQRDGGVLRAAARTALRQLDADLAAKQHSNLAPLRVGVLLGGYSTERHVSVESGRNVVEKLSSSPPYRVTPLFLLDNARLSDVQRQTLGLAAEPAFSLWQLPLPYLLKDNADDIAERIVHSLHGAPESAVLHEIRQRTNALVAQVAGSPLSAPSLIRWSELTQHVDFAFLGLHGRPGEDGQIQTLLDQLGLPYNGSGRTSAALMMQKYETNEVLQATGLLIPRHYVLREIDYAREAEHALTAAELALGYPMIAKPADEGCSSAVKRISNRRSLEAFVRAMFRTSERIGLAEADILAVKPTDEFPIKAEVLLEELVPANGARLIEVTVGVLTERSADSSLSYRALEPSETLASGEVLSLEEKFLAGEGQNITPARFSADPTEQQRVSTLVRQHIERAARALGIEGYARIDAFVRLYADSRVEVVFIEANALPALTPATCLFHQAALANYTPLGLLERLIEQGQARRQGQ